MERRFVRSHTCGELRPEHLNEEILLCGWVATRRDHGGVIFIDLRDRYGITQVVFDPAHSAGKSAHQEAEKIRSEFVLWCRGRVRRRPEGMKNPKMSTGEVELICTDIEILSVAKTPPFQIEENLEVDETVRLKYRYLDLRRPTIQKNIIQRSQIVQAIRKVLEKHHFLEIETPILYKSTPEGARDFIVPSRLNPGTFYALPQSPQTLKQLLMVAGMDRYYQVARCFRDEDLRADRQPEFSQIDIEGSFIDEEILFPVIEEAMSEVWLKLLGQKIETPFPRMTYEEAMNRFGSDKPDRRFGYELQEVSEIFEKSEFQVFKTALTQGSRGKRGSVRAIMVQGASEKFSRKDLDDLHAEAVRYGAKGLLWIKVKEGMELQSPAAKFFSADEKSRLEKKLQLRPGDLIVMVADSSNKVVFDALGAVRLEIGSRMGKVPKLGQGKPDFFWITHFPLLAFEEKDQRYYALHHPFTSPRPEFVGDLVAGKNLEKMQAAAYDLVLNGMELGGGSLRIHRSDVQDAMFRALGMSEKEIVEKFGFFIDALKYGTPPHGGIALGLDRLAATICGTSAIRDVMAFPKTQKGHCLMSESPSTVAPEQLVELGIGLSPRVQKK